MKSQILSRINGIHHDFGTREEPIATSLLKVWEEKKPKWKQVHGDRFVEVTHASQDCGETDALWTQTRGLPIAIVTADCVPVILSKNDGSKVAVIHAGWRGTFQLITEKIWNFFETQYSETPDQWSVAIGPCISGKVYEVTEQMIEDFKKKFPNIKPSIFNPTYRHLDLSALHEAHFRHLGFKKIDRFRNCTFSDQKNESPLFNSYRRDQPQSGRQYTTAMIL